RMGPQIEDAARKAVPVVDTAHDKLVDELLPKVVAAVTAAAAATAIGPDKARDGASAKLVEASHVAPPKTCHRLRHTVLGVLTGGLVAAAVQPWRRSTPNHDPWAEDPWEPAPGEEGFKARAAEVREEFKGVVDDVRHELGDAAEAVGEAAGEAVAKTQETTAPRRRPSTTAGDDATVTQPIADAATDKEMADKLEEQLAGSAGGADEGGDTSSEATEETKADGEDEKTS